MSKSRNFSEYCGIFEKKTLVEIHFLNVLATKFREVGGWNLKLSMSSIYSSNKIAVMYIQFFMISIFKKTYQNCAIFWNIAAFLRKKPL